MRGAGTRFLLIPFNTFSRRTTANPIIQDELTSEVSKQKINVGPFLYAQLTRYGAMTFPQMEWVLAGRTARSNLYARVRRWLQHGLIRRIAHPTKPLWAYAVMPRFFGVDSYRDEPDEDLPPRFRVREVDLEHALECTEVMTRVTGFENVTGIATEYEVLPEDMKDFALGRTPDGIVQVLRPGDTEPFEVAFEVETSRKSDRRIREIIERYVRAIESPQSAACRCCLIVATRRPIFEAYANAIERFPSCSKSFRVLAHSDLSDLKSQLFGLDRKKPGISTERMRTEFQGKIQYSPMKSLFHVFPQEASTPILRGTVTPTENSTSAEGSSHE